MDILKKTKAIPELNFLLLCSHVDPNVAQQNKIKKMADTSLNWDLIYDIAHNQRILPILHCNLKKIVTEKIPPLIKKKLKKFSFQNTTRNLYIFAFLTNLLSLFNKKNIDVVSFKGLLTAHDIYGDIALRSFSDIDILVKKKTASKAWSLLIKNGFTPELSLDPQQIKKYIGVEDNISFFNTKNNLNVELHWEMTGIYLKNPLSYENIESRLNTIAINGRAFKNISPEDLLIYLCIHGAKHKWEYLEQVCSVSELLKGKKNLDWELIEILSDKWQCINILLLGLNLAKMLFDAHVPDKMNSKIISNKVITNISETLIKNMFHSHYEQLSFFRPERFTNFHFEIKDCFFDKLLYFLRLTFRPTKKEWLYFPVWAPLSFIHYFLRPFRLISTGLTKKNA